MVLIGVDPHKETHTAVAVDASEQLIARLTVRADRRQVQRLLEWAEPLGPERVWAVESANGLGHPLSQQLVSAGEQVLDVPLRRTQQPHTRRQGGGVAEDPKQQATPSLRMEGRQQTPCTRPAQGSLIVGGLRGPPGCGPLATTRATRPAGRRRRWPRAARRARSAIGQHPLVLLGPRHGGPASSLVELEGGALGTWPAERVAPVRRPWSTCCDQSVTNLVTGRPRHRRRRNRFSWSGVVGPGGIEPPTEGL